MDEEADRDGGDGEKRGLARLYAWAAFLGGLASLLSALKGCGP